MVARIKPGNSLRKSFFYNETKLESGQARWLHAENYPLKMEDLTPELRLKMLEKTAALKPNLKVNSVHISLNFDPSEKLSEDKYIAVAKEYMERLGFGNQPYLIYEHYDSGHPHIHLVTTNVVSETERIDLHHLAIRKSEPARKEVEKLFNLVEAEGKDSIKRDLEPIPLESITYGKRETKKALSTILEGLHKSYKYASLAEFNALLKLYNVRADRGPEASRIFKNDGLLYRILDADGRSVGVPIKASSFHFSPTLKSLESHFTHSITARKPYADRLKNSIDFYFMKAKKTSIQGLSRSLEKTGIALVMHKSEEGRLYGVTYVDHKTRCVFKGSDLGKAYSAKMILDRCDQSVQAQSPYKLATAKPNNPVNTGWTPVPFKPDFIPDFNMQMLMSNLIEELLAPENDSSYLPYELTGRKKKKKKKKNR